MQLALSSLHWDWGKRIWVKMCLRDFKFHIEKSGAVAHTALHLTQVSRLHQIINLKLIFSYRSGAFFTLVAFILWTGYYFTQRPLPEGMRPSPTGW